MLTISVHNQPLVVTVFQISFRYIQPFLIFTTNTLTMNPINIGNVITILLTFSHSISDKFCSGTPRSFRNWISSSIFNLTKSNSISIICPNAVKLKASSHYICILVANICWQSTFFHYYLHTTWHICLLKFHYCHSKSECCLSDTCPCWGQEITKIIPRDNLHPEHWKQ